MIRSEIIGRSVVAFPFSPLIVTLNSLHHKIEGKTSCSSNLEDWKMWCVLYVRDLGVSRAPFASLMACLKLCRPGAHNRHLKLHSAIPLHAIGCAFFRLTPPPPPSVSLLCWSSLFFDFVPAGLFQWLLGGKPRISASFLGMDCD